MDSYEISAKYNQWMNNSIYNTCVKMGQESIESNQSAFFGSILKTLNHLLVGDIIWLYRCSGDKSHLNLKDAGGNRVTISGLDQILYADLKELFEIRQKIDLCIISYINGLDRGNNDKLIVYKTSQGVDKTNTLADILMHWFNHQTHHRGQVTAMISQQGYDYGSTDLIYIKDDF